MHYWPQNTKDKPLTVLEIILSMLRKHVTKVIITIGLVYLVYTLHFLSTLNTEEKQLGELHRSKKGEAASIKVEVHSGNRPEEFDVIDKTQEHRAERMRILKDLYNLPCSDDSTYKLNETLSRTIDLDRPAPDLRPQMCTTLNYDLDSLPTVSVILPIYQEAVSMVLRAVHSIINYTPSKLLVDIILVDDNSKNDNLKGPLSQYLRLMPSKVKVIRSDRREGLIRARMKGAALAKGDVLMFQDAHTEMSSGWAEPILQYIRDHPNTVIQPTVEELNSASIQWPDRKNIDYSQKWRGVFMWDMRYAWNLVPERYSSWTLTEIDPFPNPVLVGCSLAVGKKYFNGIGGFDKGLNIWGGENIELSLRTWMCGGRVLIHPCSRISHVFKPFSYGFDGDKEKIVAKNSMRVVETWMDSHRHYFYASNFVYPFKQTDLNEIEKASLRQHKELRKKLQCKSFDWYLKNVLPEMAKPSLDTIMFGEVQNILSKACWMVSKDGYIISTTDCYTYSRMKPEQEFGLNDKGQITYFDQCVSVKTSFLLKVEPCGDKNWQTGWSFQVLPEHGQVVGILRYSLPNGSVKCVQQITNVLPVHNKEQMPQLADCKDEDAWQTWYFSYHFDFSLVPPPPV